MGKIQEMSKGKAVLHCLIVVLIFIFGPMVASIPCDLILPHVPFDKDWMYQAFRLPFYIMGVWAICLLYARKVLHAKLSDFRITKIRLKVGDWLVALGLPMVVYIVFSLIGKPVWNMELSNSEILDRLLTEILAALLAGITEEMMFRGFLMKIVEEKWNRTVAVLIPSIIFSLFHIPSMTKRDPLSLFLMIVGVSLVGILLSFSALWRNCIWGGVLIHVVWNFLVGRTISVGAEINPNAIMSIQVVDQPLITGSGFGIEASFVAILAYALFAFWVAKRYHLEYNK